MDLTAGHTIERCARVPAHRHIPFPIASCMDSASYLAGIVGGPARHDTHLTYRMPSKHPRSPAAASTVAPTRAAEALLDALDHPHKPAILAVRDAILSADPAIAEGVKWNAPSYHTAEHFATFQLRHRDGVQIVLHLGAKARPDAGVQAGVADPTGLLEWRGPDRATVTFADVADVEAKRAAFVAVLRGWLGFVGS